MKSRRWRGRRTAALVLFGASLLAARSARPQAAAVEPAGTPTPRSVRITMDTLHQLGGVPPGWMLEPPPGDAARGRQLFEQLGCHTCHVVQGAGLPPPLGAGPELSGMGSHHPAAYFTESILNPDAVIVDGTGFVGADGRSNMPRYPEMTVAELADLVAFVRGLTEGGMHHAMPSAPTAVAEADVPPAPQTAAQRFLVQAYNVKPGRLADLEDWFRREGAARFLALPGLLAIDTYVDRSSGGPRLITVLSFKDEESFIAFTNDATAQSVADRFDEFVGPHDHGVWPGAPLFRVDALSAPSAAGTSHAQP